MKSTAFNTEDLKNKKIELQNKLEVVAEMIQNIISENAHTALDQEEYQRKYDDLVKRFDSDKTNLELVTEQIRDKTARHKNLELFLDKLQKQNGLISEFNPILWNSLVDYVTVYEKDKTEVSFKNGLEITL